MYLCQGRSFRRATLRRWMEEEEEQISKGRRRKSTGRKPVVRSTPISCTKRSPFSSISSFFLVFALRVVQTHLDDQLDLGDVAVARAVLVAVVRHSSSVPTKRHFLVLRSSLLNRIARSLMINCNRTRWKLAEY